MAVREKFEIDDSDVEAGLKRIEKEVRESAKRQSDDLATEGKKGGEKQAKAIIKSLRETFNARRGQLKEDVARGVIDKNEFRRQSNEAKKAFDNGILKALDDLDRKGGASADEMTRLKRSLKNAGEAGKKSGRQTASAWSKAKVAVLAVGAAVAGSRVVGFFAGAVRGAKELGLSYLRLSATAKLYGVEQKQLNALAQEGVRTYKLTNREANELAATTAKLTVRAEQSGRATEVQARLLDLAAAQGLNAAQATEALDQALRGVDEGTDKLFQRNPSDLYREYAAEIGTTAGKLTDVQKKQAIVNAVLSEGAKVQGEYGKQLDTDIGRLTTWDRLLQSSRENIGSALIPILAELADLMGGPLQVATDAFVATLGGIRLFAVDAAVGLQDLKIAGLQAIQTISRIPGLGFMAPEAGVIQGAMQFRGALSGVAEEARAGIVSGAPRGATGVGAGTSASRASVNSGVFVPEARRRAMSQGGTRLHGTTFVPTLFENIKAAGPGAVQALSSVQGAVDAVTSAQIALTQAQLEQDQDAETAATQRVAAAKEVLRGQIAELAPIVKDLVGDEDALAEVQDALTGALKGAGVELDDQAKSWKEMASTVEGVARGVLAVADSMGILDDEQRKVLQGAVDLSSGIGRIAAGDVVGGGFQALGGVVSLASGLFGGDDEAEELRLALGDLKVSVDRLRDSMVADVSPGDLDKLISAVRIMATRTGSRSVSPFERSVLEDAASAAGLSSADLFDEDGDVIVAALELLLSRLESLNLGLFGDDLNGQLDALNFRLSIMGDEVGDAVSQLDSFLGVLNRFSPDLAKDLREALEEGGPEGAKAFLQQLATALSTGQGLDAILATYGLSASDLKRAVEAGVGFADSAGPGSVSRSVQIARSITDIQANEVVAWLQDIAFTMRDALEVSRSIESILATANGLGVAVSGASLSRTTVTGGPVGSAITTGDINISPEMTEELFWDLWRRAGEEIVRQGGIPAGVRR